MSESSPAVASVRRPSRRATQSVTLEIVAEHAGVSPQTVSRSIRRPELVSVETLERVNASIEATGYVPNLAASNLASNRSRAVAAIIPAISASIFADTIHAMDEELTAQGYHLILGSTEYRPEVEESLIRALLGRRPDGIFLVGTEHTPGSRALLERAGVPVVESWSWTDDPIDSLVGFSNEAAVTALIDYVHAQGYRHPTFGGSFATGDFRAAERRRAFEAAVRRLLPGEPIRVLDTAERGISMDAGRWLLETALEEHPKTDVLLCASDVFAAGAVLAAQRRGVRVPEDLGVTGFGGFEIAHHLVPTLTTVEIASTSVGRTAARILVERMTAPENATIEPARVDLGFSLIVGDSTR